MKVTIGHLKQIARLSKKSRAELSRMNPERAFKATGLTKYQLIYQIVFLSDAPNS